MNKNNGYLTDAKAIGERIRHRREELNSNGEIRQDDEHKMTLEELANAAGISSKQSVSKYETGTNQSMTVETLMRFAHALDCEPDYLLGRISAPKRIESKVADRLPLSINSIRYLLSLKEVYEKTESYIEKQQTNSKFRNVAKVEAAVIDAFVHTMSKNDFIDTWSHISWNIETIGFAIEQLISIPEEAGYEASENERRDLFDAGSMYAFYKDSFSKTFGGMVFDTLKELLEEGADNYADLINIRREYGRIIKEQIEEDV